MISNPFAFEKEHWKNGSQYVGGIDEVGRGCIAGPVVAACVIIDPDNFPIVSKIKDSKQLSEKKRTLLAPQIKKHALTYGIGFISQERVDQINILQATFEAMKMSIDRSKIQPDVCLIDGSQKMPFMIKQQTIVKGDQKVVSIAAASIIAKVFRDQWMIRQSRKFPMYDFPKNKGYGTKAHRLAIKDHGFCPLHRKSFNVRLDP